MNFNDFQEGDKCPDCVIGTFYYPPADNCSCHIMSPCNSCMDVVLTCDKCGLEIEEDANEL
jgi:hypothetical protein